MLRGETQKGATDYLPREPALIHRAIVSTDPEEINELFRMAMQATDPLTLFEIIETLTNIAGNESFNVSGEQVEFLLEALNQSRAFPQKFLRIEGVLQVTEYQRRGLTLTQKLLHFLKEIVSFDSPSEDGSIRSYATTIICLPESIELIFSFWPDSVSLLKMCIDKSTEVQQMMLMKIAENSDVITKIMECPADYICNVISVIFDVFNKGTETSPAMEFFVERIIELCCDPQSFESSGMGWDGLNGLVEMVQRFPGTAAFVIEHIEALAHSQLLSIEMFGADSATDSKFWSLVKECAIAIGEIPFMQIEAMAVLASQQMERDPSEVLDALSPARDITGLIHPHNSLLINAIIQIVNGAVTMSARDSECALKILCRVIAFQEPSDNQELLGELDVFTLLKWLDTEEDSEHDELLVMALIKIREAEKRSSMDFGDLWYDGATTDFLQRVIGAESDELSELAAILFADIESEC